MIFCWTVTCLLFISNLLESETLLKIKMFISCIVFCISLLFFHIYLPYLVDSVFVCMYTKKSGIFSRLCIYYWLFDIIILFFFLANREKIYKYYRINCQTKHKTTLKLTFGHYDTQKQKHVTFDAYDWPQMKSGFVFS